MTEGVRDAQLFYTASASFEAARQLSSSPVGHRLRGLHGHSFLAHVRIADSSGWTASAGDKVEELQRRLTRVTAPLDYQHLNTNVSLGEPTDLNLARWTRTGLNLSGTDRVGIQSTRDRGVDLDRNDRAHLWRRYVFEAAHQLPKVPPAHQCGRMHGHGFEVIVHADQDLSQSDNDIDYDHLDKLWAPLHAQLHHACLNDIPGLENPTSEVLSSWIWHRLKPQLTQLSWVTVYETSTCGAHFDGRHYRIWKELKLDSAVRMSRARAGDTRRRTHGHTYTLRLHLHSQLDPVMGWTMDFGDIKEKFEPVFRQLDHQPLYDIAGIKDNDVASLAGWIRNEAGARLPQLDRVDLFETRGCGAILNWGPLGPALPV